MKGVNVPFELHQDEIAVVYGCSFIFACQFCYVFLFNESALSEIFILDIV